MLAFLEWLTFDGLFKLIHDAVVAVFSFIWDHLLSVLIPFMALVQAAIAVVHPFIAQMESVLSTISPYLVFANAWVPVDLFFQLLAAYSTLWIGLVTYRLVKSWIPTLSGS